MDEWKKGACPPEQARWNRDKGGAPTQTPPLTPRCRKQSRFEAPHSSSEVWSDGNQVATAKESTRTAIGQDLRRELIDPGQRLRQLQIFWCSSVSPLRFRTVHLGFDPSNGRGWPRRASTPVAAIESGGGLASGIGRVGCGGVDCPSARCSSPFGCGRRGRAPRSGFFGTGRRSRTRR